jgi:hypothetical protein
MGILTTQVFSMMLSLKKLELQKKKKNEEKAVKEPPYENYTVPRN